MKKIKIKFLSFSILVDLHNTENAMQIWEACPIKSIINTWGNEIYFDTKINTIIDKTAKNIISKGEIAFWVEGASIAIGFGPTPISKGNEIRLVTNANIIGVTVDNLSALSIVNSGEIVIVEQI
ncbi:MAG: hypothetical protein HOF44_00850 [Pelagibacterales bacterium]|jgi:hypothetical protein|nr:hypothetical protein [Pelagibacterales bacterium]MDG2268480.1 cyclophilin-like family protein [Alphaproteobacteria bacterium]